MREQPAAVYSKCERRSVDRRNDPRYNFDAHPTLDQLIAQQGKGPITGVQALHGNFWPEDERIEDFLAALHEWRGHKKADPAA
jgi:hypothetical protein